MGARERGLRLNKWGGVEALLILERAQIHKGPLSSVHPVHGRGSRTGAQELARAELHLFLVEGRGSATRAGETAERKMQKCETCAPASSRTVVNLNRRRGTGHRGHGCGGREEDVRGCVPAILSE